MLHSYFKIKDKHYKTLDYIKNNLNSKQNTLSIKKKINKLNEYQFFFLLCDLMYHHPIEHLTVDTFKFFFEIRETIISEDDYLPFQDYVKDYVHIPITDSYVVFSSKKELESLVDYYLNTKEYPKEILITKLLVLSDKILEDIYQQVSTIKYYFLKYVEHEENIDNDLKVDYSVDIIKALENYEKNLLELYDKIQEKISEASETTSKNGNYIITTDNEILKKLYSGLEKFMFIDQSKTTLNQFIEVLKLDWQAHNYVVYLAMDNIQFKYFIDCFNQFLRNKIPLTHIERSENIENKNGKIKAKSVRTSVSKSNMPPKDFELIKSIFEKL